LDLNIPLPLISARRARGSLLINGKDILAGLASQNILSFSYTDNTSDKADDLCIEIADPFKTWMQQNLPQKGIECEAFILVYDWSGPGDTRPLRCGTFFIDEVLIKGPPNSVSVRAASIPSNTGIKTEKKNKSWEDSDLQSIAGQIAKDNNLTLSYDTKENPIVKRTDQVEKTDLEYLRDRMKESALSIKIHDKKLVVYSGKEYDQRDPVFSLVYGASNILGYEFSSKCDDTFSSAENSYVNPETGKLTKTEFSPDKPPEGVNSTLKLNEKVEYDKDGNAAYGYAQRRGKATDPGGFEQYDYANDAPAANAGKGNAGRESSQKKCESKLREKNKKERQARFRVVGNLDYLSGLNFQTVGFGIFDIKWFAESTLHEVSEGGYTTSLNLRNALEGY
jgi:phage protein D